jgi:hypothetical protein
MDSNPAWKVVGCPYLGPPLTHTLLVFWDCTEKVEAVQRVDTLLKQSCRLSEKYSPFHKFIMNLNMPEGKTFVS